MVTGAYTGSASRKTYRESLLDCALSVKLGLVQLLKKKAVVYRSGGQIQSGGEFPPQFTLDSVSS